MTDAGGFIPDPDALIAFFDELRMEGYHIGVSNYIAAQNLLLALAARGELPSEPEQFKRMLGPLVCRSPAEQEDFKRRFDHWLASGTASAGPEQSPGGRTEGGRGQTDPSKPAHAQRPLPLWFLVPLLGAIVGAALLIVFSLAQIGQPTQPGVEPGIPWYGWVGGGLVLLLILWVAWLYYRARRFLEQQETTDQPDLTRIDIPGLDRDLFPPLDFSRIAQGLREHVAVPSNHLDIDRTVEATARQAGWLTLISGVRQVRPEYLVLVDRVHARDHQAHFANEAMNHLRTYGVHCHVSVFNRDPRICFPAAGAGRPLLLRDMARRYADHRLLIFSDARRFFNVITGELESWIDLFDPWTERTIMTPIPVAQWGYHERVLRGKFVTLPATIEGLRLLTESLRRGRASRLPMDSTGSPPPEELHTHPRIWTSSDPPDQEQIDQLLAGLQKYLDDAGRYWLRASAIYPVVDWELTLYLGHTLHDANGRVLFTPQRMIALARLLWFRLGSFPDWLRERLIQGMKDDQAQAAREVLVDLVAQASKGPVTALPQGGGLTLEIARASRRTLRRKVRGPGQDGILRRFIGVRMPHPWQVLMHLFKDVRLEELLAILARLVALILAAFSRLVAPIWEGMQRMRIRGIIAAILSILAFFGIGTTFALVELITLPITLPLWGLLLLLGVWAMSLAITFAFTNQQYQARMTDQSRKTQRLMTATVVASGIVRQLRNENTRALSCNDVKAAIEVLLDEAREWLARDIPTDQKAATFLVLGDDNYFEVFAESGHYQHQIGIATGVPRRIFRHKSLAGHVYDNDEPTVLHDTHNRPVDLPWIQLKRLEHYRGRAQVPARARVGDRVRPIGVVALDIEPPYTLSDEDLELLLIITFRIAQLWLLYVDLDTVPDYPPAE